MIPITRVQFGAEEERLVLEVLRSGAIAQGPKVKELEDEFGSMFGLPHVVAVNNGTTALVAALQVLDLQPGDEVVTSPFTFVATLNAILEAGATAVFADIGEDDFNVDPSSVASRISDRTRVLMPVHLYGQMADMDPLMEIAGARGLAVVEDAAQAHGAAYRGRYAGSFGIGCFSLYATKNLTTGEGGFVTTNDAGIADSLRVLRNQGMRARYMYEMAGHNYRLTDLQAAVGIPQLQRYARTVETRGRNAARLIEGLADVPGVVVPRELPGRDHVWHQFTLRITPDARVSRDEFVERLGEAGVGSGIYYPRLVTGYDVYRDHPRVVTSETPVAERIAKEAVSIPVHHHLEEAELEQVISAVRSIAGA